LKVKKEIPDNCCYTGCARAELLQDGWTMKLTVTALAICALVAVSAGAGSSPTATPQELVAALAAAAQRGDVEKLVSDTSVRSRQALAAADSAESSLAAATSDFQSALEDRFGMGRRVRALPPPPKRKEILSQLSKIELLSLRPAGAGEVHMQVRLSLRTAAGSRTEERTLTAVQEGGEWKLDLSAVAVGIAQSAGARAKAYEQLTRQVRGGTFKERAAALAALSRAEGSPVAGAGK
jgi:hypothetical protein